MAKRKRLTPAQEGFLSAAPAAPAGAARPPGGAFSAAPIARVAGEASAAAALGELSAALESARAEGRMIESLPLGAIDPAYLVRDRLVQDEDDMAALMASLEARGQQTPVEVVALPRPNGAFTHGLISGWRRLTALQRLAQRDGGSRFARVKALVVAPVDMQAAYVAMVEENEIRANLSLYERARIALRAWHREVYPSQKAALQGLFESVSRSRRSKINSFIPLVERLDKVLQHPTAIPEKLGLELSRAIQEDSGFAGRLFARLNGGTRATAEEELAILTGMLGEQVRRPALPPVRGGPAPAPQTPPAPPAPGPRLSVPDARGAAQRRAQTAVAARFDAAAGRIELTGGGVDAALFAALEQWLKARR